MIGLPAQAEPGQPAAGHIARIVGGLSIMVGSALWAVGLAVWQPADERSTSWPAWSGWTAPSAGSHDYWIRDVRQAAILLAVGGALLAARGRRPALFCLTAIGWGALDLLADRYAVEGGAAAAGLGVAGALALTALAFGVARAGRPPSRPALFVTALVTAGLALTATSGWQLDEPVQAVPQAGMPPGYVGGPDIVGASAAAVVFDVAFVLLALACALCAQAGPRSRSRAVSAVVLAVAGCGWLVANEFVDHPGGDLTVAVQVTAGLLFGVGVAAVGLDLPSARRGRVALAAAGVVVYAAALVALLGLILLGSGISAAMTRAVGNPPVVDVDSALPVLVALVGAASGLLMAAIHRRLHLDATRPARTSSFGAQSQPR